MKMFYKYLLALSFVFFSSFGGSAVFAKSDINLKISIPLNSDKGKDEKPATHEEAEFNDKAYFPGSQIDKFQGLGTKGNSHAKGDSQMLIYYIPTITNLLLWIVAPLVVAMFLYAGIQFIYAGDDEEQLNSSKKFFQYGIMGVIFIFISYSLMTAVYNIIVT